MYEKQNYSGWKENKGFQRWKKLVNLYPNKEMEYQEVQTQILWDGDMADK